jgi:hypothetical protein
VRGGGAMLAELRSKLQERKKQQEAAAPPGAAGALGALEGIVPLPELELPESLRSIRSPPPTFAPTRVPTHSLPPSLPRDRMLEWVSTVRSEFLDIWDLNDDESDGEDAPPAPADPAAPAASAAAGDGGDRGERSARKQRARSPPPPLPLVLIGHAASLTSY